MLYPVYDTTLWYANLYLVCSNDGLYNTMMASLEYGGCWLQICLVTNVMNYSFNLTFNYQYLCMCVRITIGEWYVLHSMDIDIYYCSSCTYH